MIKVGFKKMIFVSLLLTSLVPLNANSQLLRQGKIFFERKTNLYKQFDDERMKKFIKEENKIKVDKFNLFFNDSVSLFSYVNPEVEDPMSWATMKNTVYTNSKSDDRSVFMDMFGTALTIKDKPIDRQWKITDKTRKIAGYECTRAIWQKNDSTRIYAWFTTDIIPSVGPESVRGLPGAVLGLATEDGGIVYFATKVEATQLKPEEIEIPKKKGKEFTEKELLEELTNRFKNQPMGNRIIDGIFFW